MQANAMKFTYSGGDVYFYQDEIVSALTREEELYQTHAQQSAKPEVAYFDAPAEILTVTFEFRRHDTETRLDTILDAEEELTIYPALLWDATLHVHAVPLIDGIESVEVFGWPIANERMTVKFLKSGT